MTLQDIIDDIDSKVGTDSDSYELSDKVRNINLHYNDLVSIIIQSDGRWQWDDNNATDLPIGTKDLVEGQDNYEVNALDILTISEVQVKDNDGNYQSIDPVAYSDDRQGLADDAKNENNGMPTRYTKRGNSIFLFPKPSASDTTLAAGLKIFFQRPPAPFTTGELSKSPGVNPLCHRYLSVGAALDYAEDNGMERKIQTLTARLQREAVKAENLYAKRSKDERPRLRTRVTPLSRYGLTNLS